MDELELIIDLHKDAERQGPGSPRETHKALDLMGIGNNENLRIADIGCGSGAQTMVLAEHTRGHITAVDLFPQFLVKLEYKARQLGYDNRITTSVGSMDKLAFAEEELDVIWSEGAIYNMGFETGIQAWKKFLKTGGFLAVSEITWITGSRPAELEEYWKNAYPQIDTASNKIAVLERNGYSPAAYFILPPYCWLDNYYHPMQKRFPSFLSRHGNSAAAQSLVENEKEEMELYERYKEYYSYGFYIAQKR